MGETSKVIRNEKKKLIVQESCFTIFLSNFDLQFSKKRFAICEFRSLILHLEHGTKRESATFVVEDWQLERCGSNINMLENMRCSN